MSYAPAHRKERKAAYDVAYAKAHRERIAAYQKEYAEQRREELRSYGVVYRAARREARRLQSAAYHASHREEKIAKYAADPSVGRAKTAAYRAAHPEYQHRWNAARRGAQECEHPACLVLGPVRLAWETNPHVCHLCGVQVWSGVNLHMDHVVPISRGGLHCADNLRPACATCNLKKGARVFG